MYCIIPRKDKEIDCPQQLNQEIDRLQQLPIRQLNQEIDRLQQLPIRPKRLIFSKLLSIGQCSDIKFLCRCSLVSKTFRRDISFVSSLSINHHCLEELHNFIPTVLKKFKYVQYLHVHHASPSSLNNFEWKVKFQLSSSGDSVTYGMAALSYNSIRQSSRDEQKDLICMIPLRIATRDTRIQCMSTERYVMQMSNLHDRLMLCVRSLQHLRCVHVTDGKYGNLVLDGNLLDVLRKSKYDSRKTKRKKLAWFLGNLPVDEFVMKGITTNLVLKWKEDADAFTNYDGIPTYFNLHEGEMVYDKALLSILQNHTKSAQVGYNNKLVYPDRYEAIFKSPLPVAGIYSKGSLKYGVGLKYDLPPYVSQLLPKPNTRKQMWRDDCIKDMHSNDSNVQLMGTKQLAGLLADDPRLGDLRSEDVRFLIGLLEHREKPELQFYGALALTYVDSHGAAIIREEAIPLLVNLMISKHAGNQMRGMFALMRIAYDFPESVGDLHEIGALELLKDMVYSHQRNYYELLSCATYLAIVCRAKSYLLACEKRVAFRTAKLLLQYGDDEVKPQALLALSYLSHWSYLALKRRPRRYILELISHVDPLIVIITLQLIGNIMEWGSYDQKKFMLTEGLLEELHKLSHRQYKILRYEACRIIQIIKKDRQIVSLPLGNFKIHKKEGTALFSIIEDGNGAKTDLAEHDDDFLKCLPMSSFMPLSPNEEVTTKFLKLKWRAEVYTPKKFSYLH